jgi:Arc/MetJ-type ribon-helix-helix transcriptional regulator
MRRKLGRPRVDSEDVQVRLTRPALDTLDAWIAAQPEPRPSRPEAIRFALREWLASQSAAVKSPALPPPSPEFLAKRAAFERLYQNWRLARSAFCDPDAPDYDVAGNARLDAYDAAERAVMTTPALSPSDVFYKWEVLEFLVASAAVDGEHTDNRLIVAIASIKADVIRFGLNDPKWN